jgi:CubicO group peptidase (beta-lactamase class C family)
MRCPAPGASRGRALACLLLTACAPSEPTPADPIAAAPATKPARAATKVPATAPDRPARADTQAPAPTPQRTPTPDRRAACLARNADAPARYLGLVRAFCADHHNLGNVGASLAVAEGGVLRFVATAGQRCVDGPDVTPDTGFRLGSVTKLLTTALALRFVDERRLDLDGPLLALLPELADTTDPRHQAISLRQLLAHTAGLADPHPAELGADWLPALLDRPLLAEPGRERHYANSGHAIVGLLLERLGDRPYPELLQRHLLAPLDRPHITADPALALRRATACGHLGRAPHVLALDVLHDLELGAAGARWTAAAGGVIASASDLVELTLGLVDPLRSPLSAGAIATLTTPDSPTHALGLRSRPLLGGGTLLQHAGDTGDFAADLAFAPDHGFAVAILGNTGDHLQATLALALADLLLKANDTPPGPAPQATRSLTHHHRHHSPTTAHSPVTARDSITHQQPHIPPSPRETR